MTEKKQIVAKKQAKKATKKVAKKTLPKKAPAKKRTAIATKKPRKKTVSKKPTSVKESSREKETRPKKKVAVKKTVVLPTNMSQRSVEKAKVLEQEFDHFFGDAIYKIAYVSSFCFLLVGAAIIFSGQFFSEVLPSMEAQTISSAQDTETSTVIEFDLITEIPDLISESMQVTFTAKNAESVEVKIVSLEKRFSLHLETDRLLEDKFRFVIPVEELSSGQYSLQVRVLSIDGVTAEVYELKQFYAENPNDSEEVIVQEEEIIETQDVESTTTQEEEQTTSSQEILTITDTSNTSERTEEEVLIDQTESYKAFSIDVSNGGTISGVAVLPLTVPEPVSIIELYARPVNSLDAQFITLARREFDTWRFVFDTTNIPNGTYQFFAQTQSVDGLVRTETVKLTVENTIQTIVSKSSEVLVDETISSDQIEVRPLLQISPVTSESPDEFTVDIEKADISPETDRIFTENEASLNDLLQRYAVAKQSGDPILIKAAQDALDKKREELARNALQDTRVRDIADQVNEQIIVKLEDLRNRIDTFEELRRAQTGGESSVDTDGDGISDFDENNLYGTDSLLADTDNDGVTDGIEIMRGYDPLNSAPEAVIEFESPRDSIGLVREDVLSVDEVSPIKHLEKDTHTPQVRAEIRGRGLPNSFVTLYIFSTPTVVTVRTNADGSFVYTFDKELEDGRHDVYVAVTDNAGEIMAQSNPFSFVKEAQAFTPVDAAREQTVSTDIVTNTSGNTYNIVIGLGILSFGIILLMLGISLRTQRSATKADGSLEDTETESEIKPGEHIDAT